MRMKMIISEEEKEIYLSIIEYLIQNHPYEKIHTIFEMSIDLSDGRWNDENEFGELFDDYISSKTPIMVSSIDSFMLS